MRPNSWPEEGLNIVEKLVDGVKIKVYGDRPPNLRELLRKTTDEYYDKEAVVYQGQRITYGELKHRVNRVSSALQKTYGVDKGDRVAILFTNTPEFIVSYFAVAQIGAICVPLNYRLGTEETAYQLLDTGAKAIIFEPAYLERIQAIQGRLNDLKYLFMTGDQVPEGVLSYDELEGYQGDMYEEVPIDEEDPASIMYTSGTTGKPKGAIICHRNLICNAMTVANLWGIGPETKQMVLTPLFHASALHSQMMSSVLNGGTSIVMKEFKTIPALELMEQERINLLVAVPTMYWFWINEPEIDKYDLSSIQYTISGAAPAAPELIRQLAVKFPNAKFVNAGGLTESTSCSYSLPPEAALTKQGSVGWSAPTMEIKVVDDNGEDLGVEESGELWFKGPGVCKGYWNNPEGTRESITDGWLHTGDVGKVDEDGFLFLLDRKKDMIIRGGENIYCVEVENVLYSHPQVLEAAVVGVPDKVFGEQVKAVLVLKPGEETDVEQVRVFCASQLADYKVPKYVDFAKELPRNPGGKVIKGQLK
ncbi:MAG: long-chain-fatty-acid--CoA ligase [Deltaproteobacteria bacterium]|nr:long-chain-fatty-acid--CoA ligase [Deltaproteobacteria bacterium]